MSEYPPEYMSFLRSDHRDDQERVDITLSHTAERITSELTDHTEQSEQTPNDRPFLESVKGQALDISTKLVNIVFSQIAN